MKQGWEIKKLGEVCEFVRGPFGGSLTKDCFKESGYPVYEQQNAIYSKFNFRYFIDEKKFNEMRRFTVNAGDLIMSCSGTLGKVAIVPDDAPIGIINQALLKLSIKSEHLDLNYLYKYMESPMFFDLITNGAQGAAIKNVASVQTLKALDIPIPSITDQERIVGILDSAFAKIEALRANAQQNLQNTKDLFQASLKQEFTPKQGWRKCLLKNVSVDFSRGKSKHRPRNDKRLFGGDYPFIQTGEIRNVNKYVDKYSVTYNEFGLSQSKLWNAGTVCITIAANIAETAILNFESCFPDSIIGITPDTRKTSSDFLYYLLQYSKLKLQELGKGSAQDNINLGTFENMLFSFPLLEKQQTIVEKLDALSERCRAMEENYRQTIAHCNALKQALLAKAFNGEL